VASRLHHNLGAAIDKAVKTRFPPINSHSSCQRLGDDFHQPTVYVQAIEVMMHEVSHCLASYPGPYDCSLVYRPFFSHFVLTHPVNIDNLNVRTCLSIEQR